MTAARVTQVARRALVEITPDARVTRVVRRALISQEVDLGVTTVVRRTLAAVVPCVTKWTRLWTIRRVDGVVYRFTALDRDLDFGGQTYQACGSMEPSASETGNESGSFATMTLGGIVSDDGISAADLASGRLDGARFEEWEAPWDGAPETPKLIQRGVWGRVEYSAEAGFSVEVTGDGAKLQQAPLVQVYTPGCRWKDNISDPRCGVDVEAFTVTGTVDEGLGQRSFLDAARTEDPDWFAFGKITFTSGDNDGVSAEVRGNQDGVVTLWPRLAFPISAGDTYSMIAGCDQTAPTCKSPKFDNYVNFGGFPDVPGEDSLHQTPTAH